MSQDVRPRVAPTTPRHGEEPQPRDFFPQAVHVTRTMQVNALALSQMADQKASILIGATFVVFSLLVTGVPDGAFAWSTLALAATALVSSIFAVLAVAPRLYGLPENKADTNPLFFGHFAELDEAEWTEDLIALLRDEEEAFRTMLRDTYQNGLVLYRRKFRYLTFAYGSFIFGLALTAAIYFAERVDLL
ncbi:MAG: Pycsar system effector family protein [Erythrobacter sp.]|uniref:Pycsar system effector family protein n=1 Tax=Erythrobacter sp. TaxID=1042 RepID=UPI003C74CAED